MLIETALGQIRETDGKWKPLEISYGPDIDPVLQEMTDLIQQAGFLTDSYPSRWLALKYLEGDVQIKALGARAGDIGETLERMTRRVAEHCRATLDTSPEAIIADYRYGYIAAVTRQGVFIRRGHQERIILSDKIDRVLTHRFIGPLLMISVLYGMFIVTFTVGAVPMGWLEAFFAWLANSVTMLTPPGILQSMLVDGVIGGVGGVLGFVPLIMVMFMGIAFLEDSGYMARMAYMMDRVLRIFGLHGCSVMPFIVAGGIPGGCAVPGVMGARTLRSPKEKLATLLTAPFMPCGAKVPVFLLLGGAFFKGSAATVLFWITIGSWVTALLVAWVLRNTVIRGEATPFVMELPPYRLPTLKGLLIHTWERAWQYAKKAGTVILAISILIWAFMTFPALPPEVVRGFEMERAAVQAAMPAAPSAEETRTGRSRTTRHRQPGGRGRPEAFLRRPTGNGPGIRHPPGRLRLAHQHRPPGRVRGQGGDRLDPGHGLCHGSRRGGRERKPRKPPPKGPPMEPPHRPFRHHLRHALRPLLRHRRGHGPGVLLGVGRLQHDLHHPAGLRLVDGGLPGRKPFLPDLVVRAPAKMI